MRQACMMTPLVGNAFCPLLAAHICPAPHPPPLRPVAPAAALTCAIACPLVQMRRARRAWRRCWPPCGRRAAATERTPAARMRRLPPPRPVSTLVLPSYHNVSALHVKSNNCGGAACAAPGLPCEQTLNAAPLPQPARGRKRGGTCPPPCAAPWPRCCCAWPARHSLPRWVGLERNAASLAGAICAQYVLSLQRLARLGGGAVACRE